MLRKYFARSSFLAIIFSIILSTFVNRYVQFIMEKHYSQESVEVCQNIYKDSPNMLSLKKRILFINGNTHSNLMLVDKNGNVLVAPKDSHILTGNKLKFLAFKSLNKNKIIDNNFFKILDLDIKKDIISYFKKGIFSCKVILFDNLKNMSGCFVIIVSSDEIASNLGSANSVFVFGTFFMIFLFLFYINRTSSKYLKPISEISSITKFFKKGDFKKTVREDFVIKEYNSLAKDLNNMAKELSEKQKLQSMFIASISHDIRSPITAAYGFVQAICDKIVKPEDEDFYLEKSKSELKRLIYTIDGMFDTAKLFLDQNINIEKKYVNLNKLIKDLLGLFELKLKSKNITVKKIFESENCFVMCDLNKISRVFNNLIENAIKFTSINSEIEILIKSGELENKYYISVKNYGTYIDIEDQKYIFEPFYKSDKTRNINKSGSGLGLYISKKILEMHGEKIKVNNNFILGAEFIFTLEKADINKNQDINIENIDSKIIDSKIKDAKIKDESEINTNKYIGGN